METCLVLDVQAQHKSRRQWMSCRGAPLGSLNLLEHALCIRAQVVPWCGACDGLPCLGGQGRPLLLLLLGLLLSKWHQLPWCRLCSKSGLATKGRGSSTAAGRPPVEGCPCRLRGTPCSGK